MSLSLAREIYGIIMAFTPPPHLTGFCEKPFIFQRLQDWSKMSLKSSYEVLCPQNLVFGSQLDLGKRNMQSPHSCLNGTLLFTLKAELSQSRTAWSSFAGCWDPPGLDRC